MPAVRAKTSGSNVPDAPLAKSRAVAESSQNLRQSFLVIMVGLQGPLRYTRSATASCVSVGMKSSTFHTPIHKFEIEPRGLRGSWADHFFPFLRFGTQHTHRPSLSALSLSRRAGRLPPMRTQGWGIWGTVLRKGESNFRSNHGRDFAG